MNTEEYLRLRAKNMLEKELQASVVQMAKTYGWMYYHTYSSRRSPHGFPDLTMVRGDRLLFVELKTEKGRYGPRQEEWLAALGRVAEAYTWRPTDLLDGTIASVLK